ncbi:MAG TPA: hypothetical protein H9955_10045 [Candidatus Mediterraneibacter cottocaccae]|nr:hypothetical protein [Candidatus Mediterraneibacter cottocaccae]
MKMFKALSKQLFGAKYESISKSLAVAVIVFAAVRGMEVQLEIAPPVLWLASVFVAASAMWQTLAGRRHMETVQGMLVLPYENRRFVFFYVTVLGMHALITKTLPVWALFSAVAKWSCPDMLTALLCGCMACTVSAAVYRMWRKYHIVLPLLWSAGILAVLLLTRRIVPVLVTALLSIAAAAVYLRSADAFDFYNAASAEKTARRRSGRGNIAVYLIRYLMANKNYLVNTAGLCAFAVFLPLLFRQIPGMNMFPFGLSVLCLNTPLCTLLSCDPDLERAVRALPGQSRWFGRRYCLFLFAVNGVVSGIYLCGWQILNGGNMWLHGGTVILFALSGAVLSVILEWRHPIRGWKTESDLWHHPRKYIVPLIMLLLAAFLGWMTR